MHKVSLAVVVARLALAMAADVNQTVELQPVADPSKNPSDEINIDLVQNTTMIWQKNDTGTVSVESRMQHPTVMLENIAAVKNVTCDDQTVRVTFSDANALNEAKQKWSQPGEFVVVTNTEGVCDGPNERGAYLVNKFTVDDASQRIDFSARRTDFSQVIASSEITIDSVALDPIPPPNLNRRKEFAFGKADQKTMTIPAANLAKTGPISVDMQEGHITMGYSVKGKILVFQDNKFLGGSLDVTASADAQAGFEVTSSQEFKNKFEKKMGELKFPVILAPPLFTLSPIINAECGMDVALSGKMDAQATMTLELPEAGFTIDFTDRSKSKAKPFQPKANTVARMSSQFSAQLTPYMKTSLGFAVESFGKKVASAGISMDAQMPSVFALDQAASGSTGQPDKKSGPKARSALIEPPAEFPKSVGEGDEAVGLSLRSDVSGLAERATCPNGLSRKSDLNLSIDAQAEARSKQYNINIFKKTIPIADGCYQPDFNKGQKQRRSLTSHGRNFRRLARVEASA
ncbi:hypothetical protein HIM_08702 [Hirsutella minnesotensis 3608]|uniref:DUF7029 domain-containing protein n=1 Tax=Hirsutella minnesotensis 3608 TaxID=1043627 RepID=A0A0F7ZY50_9HYPO|nr:hypothetical protein HIM_08702 [Hirsutella minnesotensis 3608]